MANSPAPLTPIDCDLRTHPFMPLDVTRLRDSDLAALEEPEACWAAVLLWCASWHQLPAASLPDDDRILANLAGFGRVVKEWSKVREGALRGWIKCSDGRLYHHAVAEKAITAWNGKLMQAWKTELARIKKHNQRHPQDQISEPSFEEYLSSRTKLDCPQDSNSNNEGQPPSVPDLSAEKPDPIDRDIERDIDINKLSNTQDNLTIVEPTKIGLVCTAIKNLFDQNRRQLLDMSHTNPDFIACIEAGASVDEFVNAAQVAIQKGKGFKYIVGIVLNQRKEAKAHDLHQGTMPIANSREAGRQVAAKSIFKTKHIQHLRHSKQKEIEVCDAKQIA